MFTSLHSSQNSTTALLRFRLLGHTMETNWVKEMNDRLNLYAKIHRVAEEMKKEQSLKNAQEKKIPMNAKDE